MLKPKADLIRVVRSETNSRAHNLAELERDPELVIELPFVCDRKLIPAPPSIKNAVSSLGHSTRVSGVAPTAPRF